MIRNGSYIRCLKMQKTPIIKPVSCWKYIVLVLTLIINYKAYSKDAHHSGNFAGQTEIAQSNIQDNNRRPLSSNFIFSIFHRGLENSSYENKRIHQKNSTDCIVSRVNLMQSALGLENLRDCIWIKSDENFLFAFCPFRAPPSIY